MSLLAPLFQLTSQDSGSLRGSVNEIWSPKRTEKKKDEIKLKHFRLLKARDNLMHLNLPYVCLTRKSTVLFVSTAIYSPLISRSWSDQKVRILDMSWMEHWEDQPTVVSHFTLFCNIDWDADKNLHLLYDNPMVYHNFCAQKNRFKFQVHLIEISLHTDRRLHPEFKIHWRCCCGTQAGSIEV